MNLPSTFRKTRIAPTPSGFLHLGNVLSFAITAALAKKTGARILLRIDDLDRERIEPEFVQDIFDSLEFLEIPWDEGPRDYDEYEQEYSQLHRMDLYNAALETLRATGQVFACECSRSDIARLAAEGGYPGTCGHKNIPLDKKDVSWRLRTGMAPLPPSMKDFVIRKKDGFPSYQLGSVVDDHHFGIDLVVRGEDLRPSTLAQTWLARLLPGNGFGETHVEHHLLLLDTTDQKLSKSAGAQSVQYLRKEGKKPEDIYSLIGVMLGAAGPVRNFRELAEAAGYFILLLSFCTIAGNALP
jgi:glutamyl/glutaminyl-tRNA synthetase